MSDLFSTIKKVIEPMQGWTSVSKGQTFAAVVLALRPEVSVEIGCWHGRSTFSIALAHKEIGRGILHTIDPWSQQASAEGQLEADRKHWAAADHESAYIGFMQNRKSLGLESIIQVHRVKSIDFEPPSGIGFLLIDGNHGDAAIDDVKRYAPKVKTGGFVYADDIRWSTGSVEKAVALLVSMGFTRLYDIEQGAMFARI